MPRNSDFDEEVLASIRGLVNVKPFIGDITAASNRFFAATSLLSISNLGFWERSIRNELYSADHRRGFLKLLITRKSYGPWLNLFNGDGFQREGALREISQGAPNAFLFAILLRRLNDWVPQVRLAAREAIVRSAAKTETRIIVDTLWGSLPYMHSWGRWQEIDKDTLIDLVGVERVPELLALRIMRRRDGPAATILSQIARRSDIDGYLVRIADEAVQPAARARAFKMLLNGQASWLERRQWEWTDKVWCKGKYKPVLGHRRISVDIDRLQIIRKAAKDRSPAVRRIAGSAVISQLSELGKEALPLAKLLAADPYPSIAERGEFALNCLS
jgi:hypothetical protein